MAKKAGPDGAGLNPGRRIALASLRQCQKEASRVYQCVLRGEVSPLDGTRCIRMLEIVADLAEKGDLEEQLRELEQKLEEQQWAGRPNVSALRRQTKN